MAQIVTITNPLTGQPAQVDQLEHTAQEIDDAIARAIPGGAIDTALQNKADASSVYSKEESISASTRTALNLAETATPDAALAEIARQLTVTVGSTDYPGCYYRVVDGVTEWVNPPMELGVEYRTTERYMGDPVYVKLVDCGSVVDGKTIDLGLSNPAIITDAVVILQNSPGPAFYTSTGLGNFGFSYFIDYYYGRPITCAITFHVGASLNSKPSHGYVTIKYVKIK